jgi:hypothetical protein
VHGAQNVKVSQAISLLNVPLFLRGVFVAVTDISGFKVFNYCIVSLGEASVILFTLSS